MQLERGRGDRLGQRARVPEAVRAQLRADHPAVVLQRAVRGLRDPDRLPVAPDRLVVVGGAPPGRPGPALQQQADVRAVVLGQAGTRASGGSGSRRRTGWPAAGRAGRSACAARSRTGCAAPSTASLRTTRGCSVPMVHASRPPQSCPTIVASRSPSARTRPATSAASVDRVVAARRLVAGAVPAQIGGDHPEAGVGQPDQLVPPGPPELRETVQQQHERPGPGLGDVQADAVGADHPMGPRAVDEDRGGVRSVRRHEVGVAGEVGPVAEVGPAAEVGDRGRGGGAGPRPRCPWRSAASAPAGRTFRSCARPISASTAATIRKNTQTIRYASQRGTPSATSTSAIDHEQERHREQQQRRGCRQQAAAHAGPLDGRGQLGLGELDLRPDQGRDVLGRPADQLADGRLADPGDSTVLTVAPPRRSWPESSRFAAGRSSDPAVDCQPACPAAGISAVGECVHAVELVLGLVTLAAVVATVADRLRAPAPSLLVLAGLAGGPAAGSARGRR